MVIVRGKTRNLLEKAKESCILAVDVYNKPNTSFRSGAYIVLMTIAWTSLFHAIFYRQGVKYFYKESPTSRYYIKIDGQPKAWELGKCAKEYFKNKDKTYEAILKNIGFFIPFRNQIEHSFMPELDTEIFGECQSLLHNFERILNEEFGYNHSINESLTFSLQFAKTHPNSKKTKYSKEFLRIKDQIMKYRTELPDEIFTNPQYSFKAALIPVNNPNRADCAIKFVNIDDLEPEQKEQLENVFGFIREKYTPVSDLGYLRCGDVAKEVQKKLSKHYGVKIKFNAGIHHNKCCLKYNIRPKKSSANKMKTNKDFCNYNEAFDDYTYSPSWIKYLIKKLSDKEEFIRLFPQQQKQILGLLNSTDVIKKVKRELKIVHGPQVKFGPMQNLICARNYGVRPKEGEPEGNTNQKYCIYGTNGYLYTQEWPNFLINKLRDEDEFLTIFPNQKELIRSN